MSKIIQLRKIEWFFIFCFCPLLIWSQSSSSFKTFDTFFSYSTNELQAIRLLALPEESLSQKTLEEWDPLIYKITSDPLPDGRTTRLMAYLYVAQRDFALISHQITQRWLGNPDSLITKIIQLIYPNFHSEKPIKEDFYSEKIGEIVFHKIKDRFQHEEANLKDYPAKNGPHDWKEIPPYFGLRVGSCIPWMLTSLKDFQAVPPPGPDSLIWAYGINQILFEQSRLTPQQRQLIYYWAGQEGPESGNWFAIFNQFLQKKSLPLQNFLFFRAILAMGITDSLIAAFDSKYTYWIMRPHMRDPQIVQIVTVPKHPSYPSAHSVSSAAASTILSHFFPEEKQYWQKTAFEAVNTRIWGGLHYMYDNEQGLIQGEKIGQAVIRKIAESNDKN